MRNRKGVDLFWGEGRQELGGVEGGETLNNQHILYEGQKSTFNKMGKVKKKIQNSMH